MTFANAMWFVLGMQVGAVICAATAWVALRKSSDSSKGSSHG